ncbi:ribosomal protein L7/L12 [Paenibacillus sp. S150]|uniref:ribosomal protein L7/L12 n=1 Tax=Paenibacillus sp. S150 TaxID=2749826 RepID=UPI001C588562|nr:ribosomal protein L7/L12 [Paenibacillus sp. S150]MBW4080571.1 ribosomal protein L7/L12 [Paenibacillus sp. S150]
MENTDWISAAALALSLLFMLRVISLNKRVNELQSQLERMDSRSATGGGFIRPGGNAPTPLYVQNMEIAPDLERRLHLLLAEGKKIQAIKVIREARNLSLADAKNYIDEMERNR